MNKIEEVQKIQKDIRQEAIDLMNGLFNLPKELSNPNIERLVDCLTGIATMEIAIINRQALEDVLNDN